MSSEPLPSALTRVTYQGRPHPVRQGQTLLEALLDGGEAIPNACRAGACGACVVQATGGEIPTAAQAGMREAWKRRGYLYACLCKPTAELALEPLGEGARVAARVVERAALSPSVTRLRLRLSAALGGELGAAAGQYVTLHRDGVARSYSIAARPEPDLLELHVRHQAGGALSPYLCAQAQPGDELTVHGPLGDCFYTPGRPDQPLLLAGTGTGLAPLWGILHDALAAGHTAPIYLFHGALAPSGLYLVEELSLLAAQNPHVHYVPSVLRDAASALPTRPGIEEGALDVVIARHLPRTAGLRAFLCGDPGIVAQLKKKLFLSGTALRDIAADAFLPAAPRPLAAAPSPAPPA